MAAGRTGRRLRFRCALAAVSLRPVCWLPAMNSTPEDSNTMAFHRRVGWAAAFASTDPAQQWAAACSVAGAITAGDAWVDSTALHEAACGAWDAVRRRTGSDPVAAAVGGARRALYWERQARSRLIPPASLGVHRWRAQRAQPDPDAGRLVPIAVLRPLAADAHGRPGPESSRAATWLAGLLGEAGWPWPVPATDAVRDAIDAVVSHGRDRGAARLLEIDADLTVPVADGLVLLAAGSRRRGRRSWPGGVWLHAHLGPDVAADDPGLRALIGAVTAGRRTRPALLAGAAFHQRTENGAAMPVERAEAIAS